MANTRIKDISTAATTLNSDDFIAVDGSTAGTRKMAKADLITEVSTGVSGTYLEESNNLSDVASKDTSKLNLEVPNVGGSANEVSLNGQLGTMAFQDSAGVSVGQLEATDKIGIGTNSGSRELTIGDGTGSPNMQLLSSNSGLARIEFGDTDDGDAGELMYDHSNNKLTVNTAGSTAVTIDSSQRVGIGNSSPGNFNAAADDLVVGDSSGNRGITVSSGDASTGNLFFGDATSGSIARGAVSYDHSTNALSLTTSASTAVTVDSSQRVGIGTASPSATVEVTDATTNVAAVRVTRRSDLASTYAELGTTGGSGEVRSTDNLVLSADFDNNGSSSNIEFKVDGTSRATIDSSGNMTLETGSLTIGTAGKGIYFGATSDAAGMTAELLDDYEEGLFTPVVADAVSGGNTATVGTAQGRYTRVGRIVQFSCLVANIDTTGLTAGYGLYIQGLPFPGVAVSSWKPMTVMMDTITFSGQVVGIIGQNESAIRFKQFSSGAADSDVLVSAVASSSADIHIQGVYEVV